MIRPTNVRLRFTLLYGAALVATVVLFSAGVYFFVQKMLIGQVDNHLRRDMSTITGYLRYDPAGLEKLSKYGSIRYFRVQDSGSTLLVSEEWLEDGLEQIIPPDVADHLPYSISTPDNQRLRIFSIHEPAQTKRFEITVAHDEVSYRRTLNTLGLIIMLIMPVSIAVSLAVGYLIAGRVLAPISAITRRAEAITADKLSERLPADDSHDELNRLAIVFNQTFARLEESFGQLRQFTADASHELRTPLTAIRSIGETALRQSSCVVDCRETIGSILEETDRLAQTVEALLLLSRSDSQALEKKPVEVGEMVADVVDFLSVLAEEKEQKIQFEQNAKLTINADFGVLRRAFLNLLDNAIKYSPKQSIITISLYRNPDGDAFLDFADSGPGIPDGEKEQIFNRFYRLDSGRARSKGGAGLGLAIAKTAIEAHGGAITLLDAPGGGAIFRINFAGQQEMGP